MSESGGWTVDPLILEALKMVWAQQEEVKRLKREMYPKAVAEILSGRESTCSVWEVFDELTGTLLMDFPTYESMFPFLERLRYQHGKLIIKRRFLGRPAKR